MKDLSFLKERYYVYKGIYDNKNVYENTLEAIKVALRKNKAMYLTVCETKDKKLIVCEEDVLIRIQNQKDSLSDMTYDELSFLSFYHIPLLEEVLDITKNVPIILNLKIKKNEKLFELLDKYEGKFAIISTNSKIINWVNKNRESYIIGEVVTKRKVFNLNFYFVKSDFKSYNIEYIDKVKLKKMRESSIVLGYLINNKTKLKMYNNLFDSLIIDNYFGITKKQGGYNGKIICW